MLAQVLGRMQALLDAGWRVMRFCLGGAIGAL
jgi:hypothetical protein